MRPRRRLGHPAVDVLQVGRLPGPPRSVVDDLAGDLARREVDERHAVYRPKSARRLALSSRSKSSASTRLAAGCSAAPPAASCCDHLLEEELHEAHRRSPGRTPRRPIHRPRGVSNQAEIMQPAAGPDAPGPRTGGQSMSRASSLGRGDDAGAERRRRHHVERPVNPCCATTWPDDVMSRVSRADDSGRKSCSGPTTQGSSARISPAAPRRRASRAGRGPTFASGPTTATSTRSLARPAPRARIPPRRAGARTADAGAPPPARCATSRPTRLPASAAAARPSMPSISCSATTSPSSAETSSAPRTPAHPGDPVERRLERRSSCTRSSQLARRAAARSASRPTPRHRQRRSRAASSTVSGVGCDQEEVAVGRLDRDRVPGRRARAAGGAAPRARRRRAAAATRSPTSSPSGCAESPPSRSPLRVDQQQPSLARRSMPRTSGIGGVQPPRWRRLGPDGLGSGRCRRRRRSPARTARPHALDRRPNARDRRDRLRAARCEMLAAPPPRRRRGSRGTRCP